MPLTISVKDFQIIEDTEIEISGLTCVIGETDNGKSSLIRAIDYALHNQSGDDFVREGQDASELVIESDSIPSFKWKKPVDSGATYWLDDEKFDTVGRGTPEFLSRLGFHPLDTGSHEFDLNFWRQMEPFLLVNRPNTRKFELLSKLFEGDAFSDILSDLKDERKQVKSDREVKEELLDDKKSTLEKKKEKKADLSEFYDNYKPIVEEANYLKDILIEVGTLHNDFVSVRGQLNRLPSKDAVDQQKEKFSTSLNNAENLFDELSEKRSLLSDYCDTVSKRDTYADQLSTIEATLQQVNKVDEQKFERYNKLESLHSGYVESMRFIEESEDELRLLGQFLELTEVMSKDWEKLQEKFSLLKSFKEMKSSFSDLNDKLSKIGEKLESTQEEIEDVKSKLGVCPVCERAFDTDDHDHNEEGS